MRLAQAVLLASLVAVLASCSESTAPDEPPASMIVVSGNLQVGGVGQPLSAPLVVRVLTASGKAVKGQVVNFRVTAGGGDVYAGVGVTDGSGYASEIWTLGTVAGDHHRVEARAVDPRTGSPLVGTFGATALPGPVVTVDVEPDSVRFDAAGQTARLTAAAWDQYGNLVSDAVFTWSSDEEAVATVAQTGQVTSVGDGTANISASSGGIPASTVAIVAPDLNWIAFVRRLDNADDRTDEIYVMRPDGSQQTRITTRFGQDRSPSYSPDGRRIAFAHGPDGAQTLWVMNRDGSNLVQIPTPGDAGDPEWSPDGTQLTFSNMPVCGALWCGVGLFKVNVDGTGLAQLTFGTDARPAWSPDGQRIAFTRMVEAYTTCFWDVFVMNADGSNVTRLTNTGGSCGSGFAGWPAWSPDGQWIAFVSARTGNTEIYVMRPDGSDVTQLTFSGSSDDVPTWSPDGTRIVFQSDRDTPGSPDIYIMAANGGNQTRLTTHSQVDWLPAWR